MRTHQNSLKLSGLSGRKSVVYTDIGTDTDDVVALIYLLQQKHIDIVGVVATWVTLSLIMQARIVLCLLAVLLHSKRMLTNVINNAIRYAGNAIVSIEQKTKCILITIEDNGPGIPESELEKVFEPFYRAEHSRSRWITHFNNIQKVSGDLFKITADHQNYAKELPGSSRSIG